MEKAAALVPARLECPGEKGEPERRRERDASITLARWPRKKGEKKREHGVDAAGIACPLHFQVTASRGGEKEGEKRDVAQEIAVVKKRKGVRGGGKVSVAVFVL